MSIYRSRMPIDEPVRTFGDRFGYWLNRDSWQVGLAVGVTVVGLILGVPAVLIVGGVNWGRAADANRDVAALHHDEAIAKGPCRDVWIATEERSRVSCPHVEHKLTANQSWVRCECQKQQPGIR